MAAPKRGHHGVQNESSRHSMTHEVARSATRHSNSAVRLRADTPRRVPQRPCSKHAGQERPGAAAPRTPLPRAPQARICKGGPRAPSCHHLSPGPHPGTLGCPSTGHRENRCWSALGHATFYQYFMVEN